jgi:hypothetical protein
MDDPAALREQYLAAIEHELAEGSARLKSARAARGASASSRADVLAAIAEVNLDWLEAERDRIRAGGALDEASARGLLDA